MVPISTAKKKPAARKTKAAQVPDNQMPLNLQHRKPYAAAVHDKVVVVQLSASMSWGTITDKRLTDEAEHDTDAAKGALRVRKKLLPGESGDLLFKVQQTMGEFKQWHYARTWATPTAGQRLLPVSFYIEYMEEFNSHKDKAEAQWQALREGYPAAVESAREKLRGAFNAADYPTVDELARYFNFNVRFFPLPAGDRIAKVLGDSVAADVDSYIDELMRDATNQAKERLRAAIVRLVPYKNPKVRVYDTAMEGIDEIINLLPALNLADDPEITQLVGEVKAKLYGWAPDDLRKDVHTRTQVAKAAEDILKRMGG